jgi:hypothetical protein
MDSKKGNAMLEEALACWREALAYAKEQEGKLSAADAENVRLVQANDALLDEISELEQIIIADTAGLSDETLDALSSGNVMPWMLSILRDHDLVTSIAPTWTLTRKGAVVLKYRAAKAA